MSQATVLHATIRTIEASDISSNVQKKCRMSSCCTSTEISCGDSPRDGRYLGRKIFRAGLSRPMSQFQGFSPFFSNIKIASLIVSLVHPLTLRCVSRN